MERSLPPLNRAQTSQTEVGVVPVGAWGGRGLEAPTADHDVEGGDGLGQVEALADLLYQIIPCSLGRSTRGWRPSRRAACTPAAGSDQLPGWRSARFPARLPRWAGWSAGAGLPATTWSNSPAGTWSNWSSTARTSSNWSSTARTSSNWSSTARTSSNWSSSTWLEERSWSSSIPSPPTMARSTVERSLSPLNRAQTSQPRSASCPWSLGRSWSRSPRRRSRRRRRRWSRPVEARRSRSRAPRREPTAG